MPYFLDYLQHYTDMPFLVELDEPDGAARGRAGKYLARRRSALPAAATAGGQRGERRLEVPGVGRDRGQPAEPKGSIGFRWARAQTRASGISRCRTAPPARELRPELCFLERHDAVLSVAFETSPGSHLTRGVPVRYVDTPDGRVAVTTVFDLLHGPVRRGPRTPRRLPRELDDDNLPYTPAWQEKYTGIDRDTVLRSPASGPRTARRPRARTW